MLVLNQYSGREKKENKISCEEGECDKFDNMQNLCKETKLR